MSMNTNLRIAIGSDHKGVDLKEVAVEILTNWGYTVEDVGTETKESCDYSDYANAVCKRVVEGRADRGILICFSGLGAAILAAAAAGVHDSVEQAVEAMTSAGSAVYLPNPKHGPAYDRLYRAWRELADYFGRGGSGVMMELGALAGEQHAKKTEGGR